MTEDYVKARCNLLAVLRGIEYIAKEDTECAELVKNTNLAIQFLIKHGPSGNLRFSNGTATLTEGRAKSNLKLYFTSPKHFNRMMDGESNPIPIKGFTKLKFLTGPFMKFAEKLDYYLRPKPELLKDPTYFRMHTELTAYTAFFALVEIGNYDPFGKLSAKRMPNGVLQVAIEKGIGIQIRVEDGNITATKGHNPDPRAILSFSSIDSAYRVLSGELDTFTGLGSGQMSMHGFIPMLDNMNPLLDQVATYLN